MKAKMAPVNPNQAQEVKRPKPIVPKATTKGQGLVEGKVCDIIAQVRWGVTALLVSGVVGLGSGSVGMEKRREKSLKTVCMVTGNEGSTPETLWDKLNKARFPAISY